MKVPPIVMLLLLMAQASALDPPMMEWEMQYDPYLYSKFYVVHQTCDNNILLSGSIINNKEASTDSYLLLMDFDGNLIWTYGEEWSSQYAYCSQQLPDNSIITTGYCVQQVDASAALFVSIVDSAGGEIWTQVFDPTAHAEVGYGIAPLPDGGYAISGRVNGTGLQFGQAYILRMDSQGDSLWTDIWGTHTINHSKGILYKNGKLVVLVHGSGPGLPYGAHLLFYDLDGNYLFGTSYPGVGGHASAICHAQDGGYTFVTDPEGSAPAIVHTDSLGSVLWSNRASNTNMISDYTWSSINTCMDGGYIIAGSNKYLSQPDHDAYYSDSTAGSDWDSTYGWLVRFDHSGLLLWEVLLFPGNSDPVELFSARQLSEGGYIASGYYNDVGGGTGINGYVVRYAPETGIAEWEESNGETLSLRSWPNPASGPVQISLNGPEGLYSLTVHDLAGRLVREYPEVPLGGVAALVWDGLSDSGSSLTAGVYVAELHTTAGSVSTLMMRL